MPLPFRPSEGNIAPNFLAVAPTHPVPDAPEMPPPAVAETSPMVKSVRKRAPRTRRRFWLLLALTLLLGGLLSPSLWQTLLRRTLQWEVERHGGKLTIGRIEGGPFDTFHLYDVRCRRAGTVAAEDHRTDVHAARVDLTLRWPSFRRHAPLHRSWVQRLVLDGVTGRYELGGERSTGDRKRPGLPPGTWLSRHAYQFVPDGFFVRTDDFTVARGRYHLRARGLRLSGERDLPGFLLVRELELAGPGFQNILLNRHGKTRWQGDRFSLDDVELAPGVAVSSIVVDGAPLGRRRLDWRGTLAALGGEIRAQGSVNLSRTRLAVEFAGTLRALPVQAMARLLGLQGSAGGRIEQGSFSFRGDPEDWPSAELWLAAQATDFRWNRRRWQSLDLQGMVLHQRVQIHRLELRQSRNQLSLHGEFPLPVANSTAAEPPLRPWWEAGFSCAVDARLEDLLALSTLIGPRFPVLEGRMSVNGTLEAMPHQAGVDGYLNVEGSQLQARGVPLDYLRSTLVFRGDQLQVADLQATHGGDYLGGKWTRRVVGVASDAGELKVSVEDRAVYARAWEGIIDLGQLGLGSDDPHAPIQLNGTFHGPDAEGKIVFQNAAATEPMLLPALNVSEWWRDD